MLFDLELPGLWWSGLSYAGAALPLNARVSCLGRERRGEVSYDWDGLKRGDQEFILWQLTLSGRGALDYEGRHYDLGPGEALLVRVPHRHRYYFPAGAGHWEFIFLILRGLECQRVCEAASEANGPLLKYAGRTASLEHAERIFAAASQPHPDHYLLSGLAYGFGMALLSETAKAAGAARRRPEAIERAVRFALGHFAEPIGVGDLGEAAGLSLPHFSREFKRHLGKSPGAFVHQLRMERAVNLLQTEGWRVREIAERCGFASSSYFCRAFVKEFGVAPGQFKAARHPL